MDDPSCRRSWMYLFGRQVSYLQVDPTSNHFCAICISSQCKYTDLQHKDFGLAKGVATAIFSTAGTGFEIFFEDQTENMTPERPSITPIPYLIMLASHDIKVHNSPQTLACK
ncbi:uncharacterized protein LOC113347809 isoform X2 [Papaver somniferum]|uniref:uncharacterized protein LOC113347809 isoform X2 n=1 Tax=Papaver somniferum TaxID=3469 RepID=UPI000E6F7C61|nr:uncharacterized protein LOC113347809 isoform X2 [Papaver somniferum]